MAIDEFDEFTGVSAQDDPDFLSEGGDFSSDGVMGLEDAISDFSDEDLQSDEFLKNLDYDRFLILSKKELSEFLRIVEPWTKVSPDLYGKAVMIETIDNSQVVIRYINHPTYVQKVLVNKSGKMCPTFFVQVDILKKIVTESYASVVFVYENDEINISLLDNLLYVQTLHLNESEYKVDSKENNFKNIDTELARLLFKKVASILTLTDRVSEKNIVFKGDKAYLSTGVFCARLTSPFEGKETFMLYKPIVDAISTIVEQAKTTVLYAFGSDDLFVVKSDSIYFCTRISTGIESVFNPKIDELLDFDASIQLVNNSLSRIVSVVKAFDYLSDVISLSVEGSEFKVRIYNSDLTRTSDYVFPILGAPNSKAETVKVTAAAIKPYLDITGDDVRYDFNPAGFGISTDFGKFLIRKKS